MIEVSEDKAVGSGDRHACLTSRPPGMRNTQLRITVEGTEQSCGHRTVSIGLLIPYGTISRPNCRENGSHQETVLVYVFVRCKIGFTFQLC
jgi:hypothetical protein